MTCNVPSVMPSLCSSWHGMAWHGPSDPLDPQQPTKSSGVLPIIGSLEEEDSWEE
jgi:hypothetical protein